MTSKERLMIRRKDKMVYFLFALDCGDPITPEADDCMKYWADLLAKYGMKGCFVITGATARALADRGRKDVIKSVSKHEIGYHSDTHSIHPTSAEYLNEMDLNSGINEVIKKEVKGINDVAEIFGQYPVISVQPPGNSPPAVNYAMNLMNIPIIGHSIFTSFNNNFPVWYCNCLNFRYHLIMDSFFSSKANGFNEKKEEIDSLCEEKDRGLISMFTHPSSMVTKSFWDMIFAEGKNPPRSKWLVPPLRSRTEVKDIKVDLENMLSYILKKPGIKPVTYKELYNLYKEPAGKWFSQDEVITLAKGIGRELTYQKIGKIILSPAEIFSLISYSLAKFKEKKRLPAQIPWRRPMGPTSQLGRLKKKIEIDSSIFLDKTIRLNQDINRFHRLPARVNINKIVMGPGDFLLAASKVLIGISEKGSPEKRIIIKPAENYPSVIKTVDFSQIEYPLWLFPKNFKGENLIKRAKLQSWTVKPAVL